MHPRRSSTYIKQRSCKNLKGSMSREKSTSFTVMNRMFVPNAMSHTDGSFPEMMYLYLRKELKDWISLGWLTVITASRSSAQVKLLMSERLSTFLNNIPSELTKRQLWRLTMPVYTGMSRFERCVLFGKSGDSLSSTFLHTSLIWILSRLFGG